MNLEDALKLRQGKKLVFTNGVFDILHAGHVQYLAEARKLGELLIVGVNTDDSVRMLGKGPNRPVNHLDDRIAVLEALRVVDGAVAFPERTPEELIKKLRPEVHVKGGDYAIEDLPEAKIAQAYGGQVILIPFLPGRSTTSIIERLRDE